MFALRTLLFLVSMLSFNSGRDTSHGSLVRKSRWLEGTSNLLSQRLWFNPT